MKSVFKRLAAAVAATIALSAFAVTASAETTSAADCKHTTLSASLRGPYTYTTTTHQHKVGEYTENGTTYNIYKTCTITTKYGQLYQVCIYCGKTMSISQSSMGRTHSVTT